MSRMHVGAAACALALAGCAGGNGEDESVEQRLGGLTAPTSTAEELEAALEPIARNANTLVMSDTLFFLGDRGPPTVLRFETDCVKDRCVQVDPLGETDEVTIEDELLGDDSSIGTLSAEPIGERHGIRIVRTLATDRLDTGEDTSMEGYGGWMEFGAFLIARGTIEEGEFAEVTVGFASSFGNSPNTVPAIGATWRGIVTGVDTSLTETQGHLIQGQARIDLESLHGEPVVDVAFTDLYDLDTEEARESLLWQDVEVTPDGFTDGTSLDGRFYGPNHEEAGGVFERDHIIGAFGATRQ